jgi:glycosyltransferase involved in cell wall biosynthesis
MASGSHPETSDVILYAPNVHTGGGWVLLRALLGAWPPARRLDTILDARVQARLVAGEPQSVRWVAPRLWSRIAAEFALHTAAKSARVILCFHGLPPLLPTATPVVVFLQNRLYVDGSSLSGYSLRTRLRVTCERWVARLFRHRVRQYVVQTRGMEQAVRLWLGGKRPDSMQSVKLMPFVEDLPGLDGRGVEATKWDFVYVADGEAHKNHRTLLAAWRLLAEEGLRPSLVLTLGPRDATLQREISDAARSADLRISNRGEMRREEIGGLYANARALIFPSTKESFGLPLVEAAQAGLPIVASELDYVRDVCEPEHTFDPASAVSIARAVKRFLGLAEARVPLRSPSDFWTELLGPAGP